MKVPTSENLIMDNKLKFSDRLKALLKTEAHQDVDPYIFSEPEPFGTATGRNVSIVSPKDSKVMQNCKNSKTSRGKCMKQRITSVPDAEYKVVQDHAVELDADCSVGGGGSASGDGEHIDYKFAKAGRHKQHHIGNLQRLRRGRRQSRDHTLLYYPRAGDEISDSDSSGDEMTVYQRYWFPGESSTTLNRSARLSQLRSQLRRRLLQLHKSGTDSEILLRDRARCLLEAAYKDPASTARALNGNPSTSKVVNEPLLVGGLCGADGCQQTSLPCTRHCSRHIMLNGDQLLFEHCTAKFSDNTQCCIPVFDVAHELPLCPEHARKRDNYHRKAQESKPKKARKKPTSPTIPRPKPKSRPKKRKRPPANKLETKGPTLVHEESQYLNQVNSSEAQAKTLSNLNTVAQGTSNSANLNLGLGLGLGAGLKVDLGDHEVFPSLDAAEHDFGNVLNNLPADAFNDLFIEGRNGEYEPSREEEEELERALEAVDKDVRNLERMGHTHGLLEPALLAQLMSDIAS
ncbi:INO80 complex subunit D isoform X1 [Ceratina calcarata]|uniref:INO80 complex subunit D isoform X1 n=1 Tax=Ceratina calcarata TaxID=156304 RepID=A0AAJ7SBN5_9HYME|nr:INO80 complex subunit D isoform X1 [Ceratina calcarata]XP_017891806.1 INO80 complex subunit D isoform X3 [Ceratina calcarata]XP_026675138.1 INO80 complex subunit D isoform X2 [Ceratina calcarata]XP_026675139.1 INO80 complex subunit D isoform X1 [Ceratina calcarata]